MITPKTVIAHRQEAALIDWLLSDWLPSDWQLALTTVCLSLIIIAFVIVALRRTFVTQAEFARLQRKFEQVSEDVKRLLRAEERRFMNELKAPKKDGDEPPKVA